jgi:hypothetical protein
MDPENVASLSQSSYVVPISGSEFSSALPRRVRIADLQSPT